MKISLLQQMYKDVLVGIPLTKESHHYASLLNLCVEQSAEGDESCHRMHLSSTNGGTGSHQDTEMPGVVVTTTDDVSNSFANLSSSFCPREMMLLQLTLIKIMAAKAESQETEFSMRQKYCEIFVLLLKEAKIDSKLVFLLGSCDQLLSHMASRSLASLVYFQLKEENTLNVTWLTFSLKTLSGFPVNTRVAQCLWTLTTVVKDILKDKALPKAGDFQNSMSQLLMFWMNHLKSSLQSRPVVHHCEWLSLVFIEQDDDMWEAAKALLLIYLKFDRLRHDAAHNLNEKEEEIWNFLTHASGYNPHCIFLFFLEKIAFDSTVLLDFLISSETCFLEYLVRYLKLLRKDWHQLVDVCNHFDTKHGAFQSVSSVKPPHQEKQSCKTDESLQNACCEPEPQTLVSLAASHNYFALTTEQGDNEVVKSNRSNFLIGTDSTSLMGSLQSLVNYDSSEDSELESDGKDCLLNIKQVPLNNEGEMGIREAGCSYMDGEQNTLKAEVLPVKQKGSNALSSVTCMASLDNVIPQRIMLYKSTKCLEELQKAISRLQRRDLFPYNPSALLKLLSHIEHINKNMNPQ
ncbi:protein Lines homolog 1 isoform X2 [Neopsephotus bourkii]|uniref:protein Lines homolog 1 isoform X2 n=1 Tax=Neopsephotus bourkii TaxID=309878 RepID=UPI002AA57A08|nr:protein Lines homolog 1 isoform X2 [Neopsephotus bourkii]